MLVTKPLLVTGKGLYVNVDANKGALKVDVLDEHGRVTAESAQIRGDQPRVQMKWDNGDVAD